MSLRRTVCAALTLLSAAAAAVDSSSASYEARRQEICASHPLAAEPAPAATSLGSCDEVELFFGFERAPDYSAARECASSDQRRTGGALLGGPGVLTLIYAKGLGVPRDISRAQAYACGNSYIGNDDLVPLLEALDGMRTNPSMTLDLCEYASSTPSANQCAAVAARWSAVHRDAQILAYAPPSASAALRRAFARLREAENSFAKLRAANEVDMSGTGRAMFYLAEKDTLDEQVLRNLHDFSIGNIPRAGAREAAAADLEMASALAALHQRGLPPSGSTVSLQGIEQTQAAWLEARRAWTDFAALAWPSLSSERVHWRLTRQRIRQIKGLERYTQALGN